MSDIIFFDFDGDPVRVVTIDGEPWFIGKDVCRCLAIVNHRDAMSRLATDEVRNGVATTDPVRNDRLAVAISEPGVYRLIFESRKPEAERFKRWVCHEVLPSIRKTGAYRMADPDFEVIRDKIYLVRETRLTHGRRAAQEMWALLGLPDVAQEVENKGQSGNPLLDYVNAFLDELVVDDPAGRVAARAMHEAYCRWARAENAPQIISPVLGKMIAGTGRMRSIKSNGNKFWAGCRLDASRMKALS